MPKVAATLASLLLIASSIGVNIARYPHVGRAVAQGQTDSDPAIGSAGMARVAFAEGDVSQELPPRGASAPSAPTEPAAKPESPVPQKPIPAKKENRAKKPAAKPLPEKVPAGQIVPIVDVRPVMPPADQQGIESARTAVIADDVRRLPPVESSREDRPSFSSNAAAELASYPTTATP